MTEALPSKQRIRIRYWQAYIPVRREQNHAIDAFAGSGDETRSIVIVQQAPTGTG